MGTGEGSQGSTNRAAQHVPRWWRGSSLEMGSSKRSRSIVAVCYKRLNCRPYPNLHTFKVVVKSGYHSFFQVTCVFPEVNILFSLISDFNKVCINNSKNVVFCIYFQIFLWSTVFKCSWLKHKLKLCVFKCTIIWRSKFRFVIHLKEMINYKTDGIIGWNYI
jgi:hypothetical protein